MEPRVAARVPSWIGEGALYHPDQEAVYWVDIPPGDLYRYDPATDDHELLHTDPPIGGFTFQADGSVLYFGGEGRVRIWDDGETESVREDIEGEEGMRFNDVIADPEGRVFAGTMTDADHSVGRLYRIDTDGSVARLEDEIQLPNGMGFSPDEETFYLVETNTNTIYRYDYDGATGDLSNREVFARADAEWGYDGLTVDADGGVWTGLWGGSAVVRHTPDGEIDERVDVPAEHVTTLSFGGDAYETAYVSSATYEAPVTDAKAGRLFAVETDHRGRPEHYSDVRP